jgi:hypothetical protein
MTLTMLRVRKPLKTEVFSGSLKKNRKERAVLRKEHQGIRFLGGLCVFDF